MMQSTTNLSSTGAMILTPSIVVNGTKLAVDLTQIRVFSIQLMPTRLEDI